MFPSTAPSMTPVPGCSNENTGINYCFNPKFDGAPVHQQLDSSLGWDAHNFNRRLVVCEGDCDDDSHCEDGLVCFHRDGISAPPPPGCTGTPITNMDYCIYPELKEIPPVEALVNDGAFLRVDDDGTVKVFSINGGIIWNSGSSLVQETAKFDIGSDVSIHLAKHLLYASDYSHSSIFKDFDRSEGGFHADSNSIEIHGSISLAYELLDPFPVSSLSRISFNVTLGNGTEALAICMDDDLTPMKDSGDHRAETTCLAIGGSSIETVLQNPIRLQILEESSSGPEEIVYSLMDLFPTRSTSAIKYIGFVKVTSDNGDIQLSPSLFESIRFYDVDEDGQDNGRRLNIAENCTAGELVATLRAGLQDTLQDIGDFCVPSLTMLKQIVLEEFEYCLDNTECRSGLCESNKCKSRVRSTALDSPFLHTPTTNIF